MVLEPFLIVMRVIRDQCKRNSVWSSLKLWVKDLPNGLCFNNKLTHIVSIAIFFLYSPWKY